MISNSYLQTTTSKYKLYLDFWLTDYFKSLILFQFHVIKLSMYGNKTVRHQDNSAPIEKDSSTPRQIGTRTNRHHIFFQTSVISFFKIKLKKVKCNQNIIGLNIL